MNNETKTKPEDVVNREALRCQSSLVEYLLEKNEELYLEIENFYEVFGRYGTFEADCPECPEINVELDKENGLCEDCFNGQANPQEIFEWWLVSSWLFGKLKAKGEPVLYHQDFDQYWWGRTTTGQSISMDSVLKEIAADIDRDYEEAVKK